MTAIVTRHRAEKRGDPKHHARSVRSAQQQAMTEKPRRVAVGERGDLASLKSTVEIAS
jgi:hypothetical protein